LEKIWNEQDISIELQNYFVEQTKQIYRALVESLSNQKDPNLSTWAKKRGCWDYIKGQNFIINIPSQYVTTSQRNILVMIEGELLDKSPDYWFALSKWGKESGQLTSFERRIVFSMGKITIKNNKPSAKQFSQLEKIYNKVKELDFDSYFEELKIDI
jgi:hypothetical protein